MVKSATEPEHNTKPWQERKQHTLDSIKKFSKNEAVLCCADKLANLRDIQRDLILSENVWEKFNEGRDKQKWYYQGLQKELQLIIGDEPIYKEFSKRVGKVFG
jgi:hypothetical protein